MCHYLNCPLPSRWPVFSLTMSSGFTGSPSTWFRTEAPSLHHKCGRSFARQWAPWQVCLPVTTLRLTARQSGPIRTWSRLSVALLPITQSPGAPSSGGSSIPTTPSPARPRVCRPSCVVWVTNPPCFLSRRLPWPSPRLRNTSGESRRYGGLPG